MTDSSFTEIGGKAGYMSTDAGRWVDVLMAACGSSLLIASIFSVKEAKTSAEKEDGEGSDGMQKNRRFRQPEGGWGNECVRKCNRIASLRLVALIF